MKKLLLITMMLAVAAVAAACSPEAQQKVQEGLQTAAPTIQAEVGTKVSAALQTAEPTIQAAAQAAGTEVAAGVQTAAPTLVAAVGNLGATIDKVTALATVWEWQGTKMNDDTERTPADPAAYTVNFMVGGNLAVQADCNTATGKYEVDGENLTITLGAVTLAMCPEGSLSEAFLKDLGEVGGAMMDGDNLVLTLKMDSGSMIFAPAK
jgi:heat shock protein HslJ